jgi:V/A-type H+/Na+-transporting ATPase subunit G/H
MQNVRFSTAIRGYDRDEVDRYMRKMNTLLAELQITAAPEAAIKAALERVRDERRSVIEQAEQEAEEIIRQSRSQAEQRLEEARQEAERLREAAAAEAHGSQAAAETRIGRLEGEVQRMMEERDRALEELVELSRRVDELLERNGRDGREAPAPVKAGGA